METLHKEETLNSDAYHKLLTNTIQVGKELRSISKYSPYEWLEDCIRPYTRVLLDLIHGSKKIIVKRITLLDLNRFDNYFSENIKFYSKIMKNYLHREELSIRLNTIQNFSNQICLDVLNVFLKIHNPIKDALLVDVNESKHFHKNIYDGQWHEILIYNHCALVVNLDDNKKYKIIKIDGVNDIQKIKSDWEDFYSTLESAPYTRPIESEIREISMRHNIMFNKNNLSNLFRKSFNGKSTAGRVLPNRKTIK